MFAKFIVCERPPQFCVSVFTKNQIKTIGCCQSFLLTLTLHCATADGYWRRLTVFLVDARQNLKIRSSVKFLKSTVIYSASTYFTVRTEPNCSFYRFARNTWIHPRRWRGEFHFISGIISGFWGDCNFFAVAFVDFFQNLKYTYCLSKQITK